MEDVAHYLDGYPIAATKLDRYDCSQVPGGDGTNSSLFNFTTPPAVGSYPLRMGVFADVGQTFNSSETLRRLLLAGSSILSFVGDWS